MKSVFEAATREELIRRVNSVSDQHKALWGKMNAFQMVKHCTLEEDMFHGTLKIKRVFLGRLIGRMFLKKELKEGQPLTKNAPTSPLLMTAGQSGDIELQKKEWIKRITQYSDFMNTDFVHPFFGPMTKEEVGMFAYKHADHHLRQFGA